MRRALALLAVTALCGCEVWSGTIRTDVVDYSDVLETTTNQFLLINVLQARDDAPLHFAALPNIHGSLQATASLTGTIPYEQGIEGARSAAEAASGTTPATPASPAAAFLNGSIAPTISAQSSPSYEVDSVEAKDFVTGITSPIDPKYIKYWIDRGLDKRIILLLFFSSAQITEKVYAKNANGAYIWVSKDAKASKKEKAKKGASNGDHERRCTSSELTKTDACVPKVLATQTITVFNDPRHAADQLFVCQDKRGGLRDDCHARTQFEHYLTLSDAIGDDITAHAYTERKTLSGAFNLDLSRNLKGLGALDTTKYKLEYQKSKKYELFATSSDQNIVLCYNHSLKNSVPLSGETNGHADEKSDDTCTLSVVTKDPVDPDSAKKDPADYPVNPETDNNFSSSGDCADEKMGPPNGTGDLNYCEIYSSFLCYASSLPKVLGPSENDTYLKLARTRRLFAPEERCDHKRDERPLSLDKISHIWPDNTFTLQFNVRSVAEMIRFLGDLIYYQEKMKGPDNAHNIPVTLGWSDPIHIKTDAKGVAIKDKNGALEHTGLSTCRIEDGGCLFIVSKGAGDGRINVNYRGESYSIANHDPNDHSLEVLSIVNQLVNLNHSATDLRTTPTVQIVP